MRQVSPLNRRRWRNFKANRRGLISLWLFGILFFVTLFAEFLANDKPLLVLHNGGVYTPVFVAYPETDFGGAFATETDYRDREREPSTTCGHVLSAHPAHYR